MFNYVRVLVEGCSHLTCTSTDPETRMNETKLHCCEDVPRRPLGRLSCPLTPVGQLHLYSRNPSCELFMSAHQYFTHMQSYFCPACKPESLMETPKNNKHVDLERLWSSSPRRHSHSSSDAPSNHICNSNLTLWPALIKRKLVFIFKLLSPDSCLGCSHNDFMLKFLFGESIKFFQSNLLEKLWLD